MKRLSPLVISLLGLATPAVAFAADEEPTLTVEEQQDLWSRWTLSAGCTFTKELNGWWQAEAGRDLLQYARLAGGVRMLSQGVRPFGKVDLRWPVRYAAYGIAIETSYGAFNENGLLTEGPRWQDALAVGGEVFLEFRSTALPFVRVGLSHGQLTSGECKNDRCGSERPSWTGLSATFGFSL